MNNVLIVTSSALGSSSVSKRIADEYETLLRRAHPDAEIVRRDVGSEPIPHLTAETRCATSRAATPAPPTRRTCAG